MALVVGMFVYNHIGGGLGGEQGLEIPNSEKMLSSSMEIPCSIVFNTKLDLLRSATRDAPAGGGLGREAEPERPPFPNAGDHEQQFIMVNQQLRITHYCSSINRATKLSESYVGA